MEAYFDNSATTRCYKEVADIVVKTMTEDFGNPSAMHLKGVEAEKYVRDSAQTLARLLKVNEKEIIFTSGGTESNNLALFGGAEANKRMGNHIITTAVEHAAVGQPVERLEQMGADGVVPVVAYSFPPQRCFVIEQDRVKYKWEENRLKRSQDLERYYHDCGQFYLLRVEAFRKERSMVLHNTIPYIMDEMKVQDIDTPEDWKLAEVKYRLGM